MKNNLHYKTYGSGNPIIFVGGLGATIESWQLQIEHFSAKHQVIVVDLPGLGKSAPLDGQPTVNSYADALAKLIKDLGFKQIDYVGVSIGGAVGYALAARYPKMVKNLTVINMDTLMAPRLYQMYQIGLKVLGARQFGRLLSKMYLTGQNKEAVTEWIENYPKNGKQNLATAMKSLKNWDIRSDLKNIKCPVLVIASEDDKTPVETKKAHLQNVSQLSFSVVKGARHFVHLDKPMVVNSLIDDFLAGKPQNRNR